MAVDPVQYMKELIEQIRIVVREEAARVPPQQHAQVQNSFGHLPAPTVPQVVHVYRMTPEGERVMVRTTTAQLLAEACDILLDISDAMAVREQRSRRRKRS